MKSLHLSRVQEFSILKLHGHKKFNLYSMKTTATEFNEVISCQNEVKDKAKRSILTKI